MTATSKDSDTYLRSLRKAGYQVQLNGGNHWEIRWGNRLVAVQSKTPGRNRGLANLKARIRKFEREHHPCP